MFPMSSLQTAGRSDMSVSFSQAAPDDSHRLCVIHREQFESKIISIPPLITGVQTPDCNQASFVVDLHRKFPAKLLWVKERLGA